MTNTSPQAYFRAVAYQEPIAVCCATPCGWNGLCPSPGVGNSMRSPARYCTVNFKNMTRSGLWDRIWPQVRAWLSTTGISARAGARALLCPRNGGCTTCNSIVAACTLKPNAMLRTCALSLEHAAVYPPFARAMRTALFIPRALSVGPGGLVRGARRGGNGCTRRTAGVSRLTSVYFGGHAVCLELASAGRDP